MNPEIILGPPGTGKTTTLLNMVDEELLNGVPPDRIGYVSFTRRAAKVAIDRASERFKLRPKDFPWFRTLHSLCFRFLGVTSSSVLDGAHLDKFADFIGETIQGKFTPDEGFFNGSEVGDRMLFMDNLARVRNVTLREQYEVFHDDIDWRRIERFSRGLAEYKRAHSLIDYTDMLESFVRGGSRPELEVLFVDEAQDLSTLQWRVVRKLATGCRRVVVAGDDDQAIYRWAGADVDYLIDLQGHVRVLGQSWRVPRSIQHIAATTIERVAHRRPKEWLPRDDDGRVTVHRDLTSIDWAKDPSILVLARNAVFLNRVQADLKSMGFLYEIHGASSVPQSQLRAATTWVYLSRGNSVSYEDAKHMYTFMVAGKGVARGHKLLPGLPEDQPISMQDLIDRGGLLARGEWYDVLEKISAVDRTYMQRCRRQGERFTQPPRIRLSTIHGSKGGEADRVVLLTDMATRTMREFRRYPDDEHRAWYVALTRAKQHLQIIEPGTGGYYDI